MRYLHRGMLLQEKLDIILSECTIDSNDCMISNKGKDSQGYACIWYKNTNMHIARAILLAQNIDMTNLDACHDCGNRACVNPLHIYAGTHEQNLHDMRKHNTINHGNNPNSIVWKHEAYIYKLYRSGVTQREIAKQFGVTYQAISYAIQRYHRRRAKQKRLKRNNI